MSAVVYYVQERLGSEATEQDAKSLVGMAEAIWQEQIDAGLGEPDECVTKDGLIDWLSNRTYDWTLLCEAANGDVMALSMVRSEAGLPVIV